MKPGQQAGGGARATFHIVPAEVHIGEPFVVRLEVQHDSADGLKSQAKPPFAKTGEDWMLIRGPETRTLGRLGAQETTQVEWTYLSLQPGDHDT
ncbi:MAG: hypothetical protein R3F17_12315, partial [Planctomycetota bacterium]